MNVLTLFQEPIEKKISEVEYETIIFDMLKKYIDLRDSSIIIGISLRNSC